MLIKRLLPVVLTGLVFANPLALAEETTGQVAQGGAGSEESSGATAAGQAPESAAPAQGMQMEPGMMGGHGMMGGQGAAGKGEGMAMEPGMQGPGKEGCHMGKGGMKGMMMPGGCMGKGGMMCGGMMGQGGGITQEQFRELSGRLRVLEARLAKIENMLEQLLQQ